MSLLALLLLTVLWLTLTCLSALLFAGIAVVDADILVDIAVADSSQVDADMLVNIALTMHRFLCACSNERCRNDSQK